MRNFLVVLPLAVLAAAPLAAAEPVAVSAFRSIELRGGGAVTIHRGPVQRVTIVSGSSQFTRMHVERGSKLVIEACNERCPRNYDLRIDIVSPTVPDAAISGGGDIRVARGFAPQGEVSLAIRGGGTIDARTLPVTDASAAVLGGGTIFAGPARNLSVAVNGGGDVYAGSPQKLSAAVHGGGDVHYSGNPVVSMAVAGGGSVHRGE